VEIYRKGLRGYVVIIAKDDCAGLERVAHYIARNSFSESKLTYNEETGSVLYRSKANYNTKRNFELTYKFHREALNSRHISYFASDRIDK
jgi:hypothetical protein